MALSGVGRGFFRSDSLDSESARLKSERIWGGTRSEHFTGAEKVELKLCPRCYERPILKTELVQDGLWQDRITYVQCRCGANSSSYITDDPDYVIEQWNEGDVLPMRPIIINTKK